jgi:hypothetical protein
MSSEVMSKPRGDLPPGLARGMPGKGRNRRSWKRQPSRDGTSRSYCCSKTRRRGIALFEGGSFFQKTRAINDTRIRTMRPRCRW